MSFKVRDLQPGAGNYVQLRKWEHSQEENSVDRKRT